MDLGGFGRFHFLAGQGQDTFHLGSHHPAISRQRAALSVSVGGIRLLQGNLWVGTKTALF